MRKMGGIRILLAALVIASISGAQAQSDTGLIAEWHFDSDAKDSSGNGNDGVIYGATFVDGKFGKALSFDGANDYVKTSSANGISNQIITVELWTKFNSFSTENQLMFIRSSGRYFYLSTWQPDGTHNGIHIGALDTAGNWGSSTYASDTDFFITNTWYHIVGIVDTVNGKIKVYRNAELIVDKGIPTGNIPGAPYEIWIGMTPENYQKMNGLIDEVRIYNRALSADEIKAHYEGKQTALTLTKTASPYSIKQGQTTTITLTVKNTGTTDITNIEVMDSIHRNFDLISGDFPNPRKYDIIGKGESREIQYMIKAKESGTFNLDPVIGIYADDKGNIQEAKSAPTSIKVIPSFESIPSITSPPMPSTVSVKSASVSLHGEKTDVVLGEDILLKLSAVNLITKPIMHVQVIIIPPSGMSVTSSEFVQSGAGQFTTTYELEPGKGRDIEVRIKSNQVGDFNVNGRIIYYFGDDKEKAEDQTLNLPIKVRKEIGSDTRTKINSRIRTIHWHKRIIIADDNFKKEAVMEMPGNTFNVRN
ncbi:MAG: DUF11 domain-containing protein [Euryarchaeota archaeon]|nr:DUF11 domain-containing protein [Euryarchaeota archaeon]